MQRRRLCGLLALAASPLPGCESEPLLRERSVADAALAPLSPWRVIEGGFLSPPGAPPRPGSGMFVRLASPSAIALRASDLLVADAASARLWRIDTGFGQAVGIAGAPAGPRSALAIGDDLSAWVLDVPARQVLRFARDGRLVQTLRVPIELPSPVAIALADGGTTLLVADSLSARWSEQRIGGGVVTRVAPQADGGSRIGSVVGLAPAGGGETLFVLDALGAAVHRVARDGRVLATWGRDALNQPSAIAADRDARVFVVDAAGSALVMLRDGVVSRRWSAGELSLQRLGAIAIDERVLALADPLTGRVATFLIGVP